jgi:hypothetical protein
VVFFENRDCGKPPFLCHRGFLLGLTRPNLASSLLAMVKTARAAPAFASPPVLIAFSLPWRNTDFGAFLVRFS